MIETEIDWPQALRSPHPEEQARAVAALREHLLRGLSISLGRRHDISPAHLEDFTQEALVRVLDRLDQFQGRSKFTTWAQAIAVNTAFAELRRKRWQDVSLDALVSAGARLPESTTLPEQDLGTHEDRSRILAALREAITHKLTPRQRAGIVGELNGLPFDQVASLLGTNRNAAYKLLHDARKSLKRHLHEAGVSAEDIQTAFPS